jgi:hypothetical protein
MKRRALNERLAQADAAGVWAFTPPSFSVLMGGVEPAYLKLMMKRLADQGVLVRAARGVYVNPRARSLPSDVRRGLLRFLRPREITYVSLESKLSEAGAISQIATALTCMTTGSPGRFETPWGVVELTHTERKIDVGTDVVVQDDGTLEATIRTAVRDLRRVGRNFDLIDQATLTEAIAEEEGSDEQQSEHADSTTVSDTQGLTPCRRLPGRRGADHVDDGGEHASAQAAGQQLADEARNVEPTGRGAGGGKAQQSAQNLPADAAADGAGKRVPWRAEAAVPGKVAGDVPAHHAAQKLNEQVDDIHGLPPDR